MSKGKRATMFDWTNSKILLTIFGTIYSLFNIAKNLYNKYWLHTSIFLAGAFIGIWAYIVSTNGI